MRIFHAVLKVAMAFSLSYFVITEYAFRWYLKDYHKTTMGQ
jgi:hypothetical protein